MFLSPTILIYGGLLIFSLMGWGYGYYESSKFTNFKTKIDAEAVVAQGKADSTNAWNEKVIKENDDAYKKRLADINTKYGRLQYDSHSSPMPTTNTSKDTIGTSSKPTDPLSFERDCTITTNMLVSLQDIIKNTEDTK